MSKTFEVKCYEKSGEGTNNELIIKCMNNHYKNSLYLFSE